MHILTCRTYSMSVYPAWLWFWQGRCVSVYFGLNCGRTLLRFVTSCLRCFLPGSVYTWYLKLVLENRMNYQGLLPLTILYFNTCFNSWQLYFLKLFVCLDDSGLENSESPECTHGLNRECIFVDCTCRPLYIINQKCQRYVWAP